MTTIAWDGKTLAADQCSWSGSVRRRVCKVFKIKSKDRGTLLVAFSGNASFATKVLDWMSGKCDRPDPRDFHRLDDLGRQCAVAIDSARRVWALSNSLIWEPMNESIFAHGAGQEFAWGALEAGATAVQAIEITARRSDFAGFGVDTVQFDEDEKG